MEVLEKQRKNLLEELDYEDKIRVLNLNKRIEWFVDNKMQMSQNEKWEAFYDIQEDYDINVDVLKKRINNVIRKKGLSVW
jgi:arginine/lysine/ornithine decarboxylase